MKTLLGKGEYMPLETLLSNPSVPIMVLIKIGLLSLFFMFFIFMLIALKQIRAMNEILTEYELFPWIQGGAYIILMTTLVLFILTVVIL